MSNKTSNPKPVNQLVKHFGIKDFFAVDIDNLHPAPSPDRSPADCSRCFADCLFRPIGFICACNMADGILVVFIQFNERGRKWKNLKPPEI
jgi:hypothetical protein